jgi:hypothetical protein
MTFATPDSNLVLIILTALINLFTAYIAHRTRGDVKVLEKNTNGKMDALLKLTAKSSKAEGVVEGKAEGHGDG